MIRYRLSFLQPSRNKIINHSKIRYLFTASRRKSNGNEYRSKSTREDRHLLAKEDELKNKIKQIQAYRLALQKYMNERQDEIMKQKAAEMENIKTDQIASSEDIEKISDFLQEPQRTGLFPNPMKTMALTDGILERTKNSLIHVSAPDKTNQKWSLVLDEIQQNGGFKGLKTKDIDMLLYQIPLTQRGQLIEKIENMMVEANISPSGLTYGHISAVYGAHGQVNQIDNLIQEMKEKGIQPNTHVYGNLIKALNKTNNLERSSQIIQQMKNEGLEVPLVIYTTVMQTCIKIKEYEKANEIFALMKFLSAETQPDLKVYNSVILSAAFQHNIERVIDLYRELTQHPDEIMAKADPEERQATYNIMIYACARDERTHLKAWEFLLELHNEGLALNRMSLQSLMYLCGTTGEIMLARAMFKQLCQNPISYPTPMILNSLFNAYSNFKGQAASKILSSPLGDKVRTNFVFDEMVTSAKTAPEIPPFLPLPTLSDKIHVLAESRAIMTFFQQRNPQMLNEKVALTYLKVASNLHNLEEFKYRYEQVTYPALDVSDGETSDIVESNRQNKAPRTHYIYDLAMQAAADTKDIEFGTQIWNERGKWRKSSEFQKLTTDNQNRSDFLFSRKMVELFTNRGEFNDAFNIIESTIDKFPWKIYHVTELHNKLIEMEDESLELRLKSILGNKKKSNRPFDEYQDYEDEELKRSFSIKAY